MSQTGETILAQVLAAFRQAGEEIAAAFEERLRKLPRSDQSGWYYIVASAGTTSDGRAMATIKPRDAPVSTNNPELGPYPCLRSYTPVAGQRVLVRWVAGDRADGVIEG